MQRIIYRLLCLYILLGSFLSVKAIDERYTARELSGNSLAKDSTSLVLDEVYFNPQLKPLQTTWFVKNLITFKINEDYQHILPDEFNVSIRLRIRHTEDNNGTPVTTDTDTTLNIEYSKFLSYKNKEVFMGSNWYKVEIIILSVWANDGDLNDFRNALMLTNEILINREYNFSCTNNVIHGVSSKDSTVSKLGELFVYWDFERAADEYDLEWTYIDSTAIGNYDSSSQAGINKIFRNNATRVSITRENYNIPLLYDSSGYLFFRVRAVQVKRNGQRIESLWSTAYTGGLGQYCFKGLDPNLNWQASTSFAEEGKRKSVVQYFDGSLKNRQTVTKDNTTYTTIIAETLYDHQGRPAIQVMPTPSLSSIIKYTPGFNRLNAPQSEYTKETYDGDLQDTCKCKVGAPAMDTSNGAAKYYSPANPLVTKDYHKYIPDAKGYVFAETKYTPDNTGRISVQSGVGEIFQIGNRHETSYTYNKADQEELDALFGTEVGNASHYFKNTVQDANGQVSISYVDMHGRTIATALAAQPAVAMDKLASNQPNYILKNLIDSTSNVIKGMVIENSNGLFVTKAGMHVFRYSLVPDSIRIKACDNSTVCYDCVYDLRITITEECNDSTQNNKAPIVITRSNQVDTACGTVNAFPSVEDSVYLSQGSYIVTKTLTINQQAMDYYRSIFLAKNTCTSLAQTIQQQKAALLSIIECEPACASCRAGLGDLETFRQNYMQQAGIPTADTASYRAQAQRVYHQQLEECNKLCDNTGLHQSIRRQMLADVTPPFGQYANPDNITLFSIFAPKPDGPGYTKVAPYIDENGNVEPVSPDSLSREEFIKQFKSSWAEALLKEHPEYRKLEKYEQLAESNVWDEHFANTQTFQAAVDSGFLNPGDFSLRPPGNIFNHNQAHRDPFFTTYIPGKIGGNYKAQMEDSLKRKTRDQYNNDVSMWSLATIMAHCPGGSFDCFNRYKSSDSAFAIGSECSGDLDIAWQYFREMYLQEKREIIELILNQEWRQHPYYQDSLLLLVAKGHRPNFIDPFMPVPETMAADSTSARDSLQHFINDNCAGYAEQWMNELAGCYSSAARAWIIPRLIEVCREGGDEHHVFGASTVKPSSTYQYRSFEEVIRAYRDLNGNPLPYNSSCNAYLITAPAPYDKQPVYFDKPVFQKPDSCECATIGSLYQQYQDAGKDSSFSAYIYRTTGTRMYQGVLDTLRMACNGQINCSFLKEPLSLPPVLQCGGENVCVDCGKVGSLYNTYLDQFPDATPLLNSEDTIQIKKNQLFERFMNTKLGFTKTAGEYLAFMDTCKNRDSLGYIFSVFNELYKKRSKVIPDSYYKGDTTDLGNWGNFSISWAESFQNGVLTYPERLIQGDNPGSIHYYYIKQIQIPDSGLSIETRLKLPLLDSTNCNLPNFQFQLRPIGGFVNVLFWPRSLQCYKPYGNFDLGDSTHPTPNRIITHHSELVIDMSDWVKIKMTVLKNKYQIFVADTFLMEMPFTGTITKMERFGLFFGTSYYNTKTLPAVDYLRVYNGCDGLLLNQEFNSVTDTTVCPDYSIRISPYDLKTVFTNYYNQQTGSSLTSTQVQQLYNAAGINLDTCKYEFRFDTLRLCGKTEPVFAAVTPRQHTTCADSTLFSFSTGTLIHDAYRDSLIGSFNDRYLAKCLKARYNETFTVYQPVSEYHYTLYYYDQAGNLVKTIPPAGVDVSKFTHARSWSDSVRTAHRRKEQLTPKHTLPTQYRYNTLNQVMAQKSPDGGLSEFWYDRLGRLAISRNARQKGASATEENRLYSYTKYDSLGRITEVGQVSNTATNGAMTDAVSRNKPVLDNWLAALYSRRGQITNTVYDLPYPGFVNFGDPRRVITQRNLRNRVSYTTLTDTGLYNIPSQGTFYTYDILGNVDHLLQDYGDDGNNITSNVMNENGNRWKKISYQYDLISGKVNMVMFQQGWRDGFFHRYSYDAENRLTLVETSKDSLVWEKDARYEYYRHGPLARVTLGDQQVQGTDYAYTLQGWLKGINSTGGSETFDMGEDGKTGSLNQFTARDALGLTLNYFGNDYTAISGGAPFPGYSSKLPVNEFRPLYNGNISSSSVYQKKFEGEVGGPLIFYNYKYDQLNRLTQQDAFTGFNVAGNQWNSQMTSMGDRLKERIAYDANGNILKYLRNSINPQARMDSLTYHYYANTNQLRWIKDTVGADGFIHPENRIVDIDSQRDINYVYDAIGNLVTDSAENIDAIKWNVYGKIEEITRTATATAPASNIKYTYDAMGNRISQVVTAGGTKKYTWYVRDAQGNILTTYSAEGANSDLGALDFRLSDRFLYGSSRLGTITVNESANGEPGSTEFYYENRKFSYDRGYKQYELTNHLGNVLATISDRKFGVSSGGSSLIDHYEPHIVTAQDYYPFGMLSRISLPNNNKSYGFGFNGQMMNNDAKGGLGNSYTAQFWEYDSRIGRRWNLDPVKKHSLSPYGTYSNNPILMLDPKGNDEYWEIDAKTGIVKMVKSDWVGDNIWIKDKDGSFKKLHEIKLELSKSSRQFDMGVASILANYVASDPLKKTESSITLNPEGIGVTSFDPNKNQISVTVIDGYVSEDLTNMFNLRSAINDHERGHQADFNNKVQTSVITHLDIYMNQMEGFFLTSQDFQSVVIGNALSLLYTVKEEKLLSKEKEEEYFAKFFKSASEAGWAIRPIYDPESDGDKVIGFDITNRNDKERNHYEVPFKNKKDEQSSK